MCGIGGILRTDGKPIPEEWLDAIDARIAWRGPDGHGRFRDRVEFVDERGEKRTVEVAFVHRRLSIIDHEGGHQPMVSERGRNDREGLVAVVFNGCIYNHRELRKELEAKGHRFVSDHSDTEVLIHGWREWGEGVHDHLEGMYAFALWDRHSARLVLARDWFGEKPLFYRLARDEGTSPVQRMITFASDLQVLAVAPPCLPNNDAHQSHEWARQFLVSGVVTWLPNWNWTAFTMEPGDFDIWNATTFNAHSFARVDLHRTPSAPHDIEHLLSSAVQRRLEADVPIGCFLSGGIDSSLIAHFAQKHTRDLNTFSVRMPDSRYDESSWAQRVAEHLATRHRTLEVEQRPADDLVHLIETLGHPFGDSSLLPSYWVSKAARVHVKVALAGDGGDEMFVGYERYLAARPLAAHHAWVQHIPSSCLARAHPKTKLHKLGRLVEASRDYDQLGLLALTTLFRPGDISELIGSMPPSSLADDSEESLFVDVDDPLVALRAWDVDHYLPSDLLRKVDTASMACGLEVRCPFLDRDLARAALSMPIDQLMPGGQRKGLLRQIARKYLPREIVDRPKMGFAIPIGEWFGSDYGGMKTLLLDHLNSTEPFGSISLNHKAVQRFIDEHMSGKRDHGQRLFTLLTLSIWAKSQQVNKSTSQK